MKINTMKLRGLGSLVAIALLTLAVGLSLIAPAHADSLYIGDGADDTIRRFNAETGGFIDVFVGSGNGGLRGPRGLLLFGNPTFFP